LPIYSFWHFDDFTWGATRIVIGEGKNKRVLAGADDEPYDDGMIPMRRYADYRQAAFDHSGAGSSDAYDTKSLAPSMIQPPSHAKHASRQSRSSQLDLLSHTRAPSYASFGQMPMVGTPVLRPPQMMMMPGPYGYAWPQSLQGSMIGGATGGSASGSDAGSVARGPIMIPTPFMSPAAPPSILSAAAGRHMSSYSLASAAAFSPPPMQPSTSTDPSDDEIVHAVRSYLSMQDLMQVTKRSACGRSGVSADVGSGEGRDASVLPVGRPRSEARLHQRLRRQVRSGSALEHSFVRRNTLTRCPSPLHHIACASARCPSLASPRAQRGGCTSTYSMEHGTTRSGEEGAGQSAEGDRLLVRVERSDSSSDAIEAAVVARLAGPESRLLRAA